MSIRRSMFLGGALLVAALSVASASVADAGTPVAAATPLASTCTNYVNAGVKWLSGIGHPTSSRTPSTVASLIKKQLPNWTGATRLAGQNALNGINANC